MPLLPEPASASVNWALVAAGLAIMAATSPTDIQTTKPGNGVLLGCGWASKRNADGSRGQATLSLQQSCSHAVTKISALRLSAAAVNRLLRWSRRTWLLVYLAYLPCAVVVALETLKHAL
jgi:hypothetical protein